MQPTMKRIILALLFFVSAHVSAANEFVLEKTSSSGDYGDEVTVTLKVNSTEVTLNQLGALLYWDKNVFALDADSSDTSSADDNDPHGTLYLTPAGYPTALAYQNNDNAKVSGVLSATASTSDQMAIRRGSQDSSNDPMFEETDKAYVNLTRNLLQTTASDPLSGYTFVAVTLKVKSNATPGSS